MDEPPARAFIDAMIADSLAAFDDDVRAAWARIRIEPALWRCADPDAPRERYWAIAIEDDRVLWYNDIEEGFNRSTFVADGIVGAYGCSQTELVEILAGIDSEMADARWPTLGLHALPGDLAGTGSIVVRQSTYWELRAATGARYRAHLRDKLEARFETAAYARAELFERHPLLVHHTAPWCTVYFTGIAADPRGLVETLERAVLTATEGWRTFASYREGGRLAQGHGMLVRAPEPVAVAVASVLEAFGVGASVVGGGTVERPPCRALVLGRSFLVAHDFRFERRPD